MIQELKKFLNEEQDSKAVEKVLEKISGLLTADEKVEYVAVQKKPAINLSPDCIALTNKRIIFCRPKSFGLSMDFQDYAWKDVADCHIKENILGATFMLRTVRNYTNTLDYLPKSQARKLYQFAQQKEEDMLDYRRQRDLEDKRAIAGGGITVTTNIPSTQKDSTSEEKKEDPIETLQKLKTLLDNNLILQEEFDKKKAEILSRL
ncbi:PH domain-containing protein [Chryseobacterium piscicola]|uniref:PH domain-containing protein n=1 Tax=Chryseobacterium piscicola TaxID=551459 RepID=A0A1N7NZV5_9FLAO|nr:PH domain-containing protein [Chryseobacterium piscicola]PQA92795.1 hypothetical protein B0A70_10445 [Chryseobacterium piscicola]SIT03821.1 PH domain-containing protein [Chryseobacterium piscicola]